MPRHFCRLGTQIISDLLSDQCLVNLRNFLSLKSNKLKRPSTKSDDRRESAIINADSRNKKRRQLMNKTTEDRVWLPTWIVEWKILRLCYRTFHASAILSRSICLAIRDRVRKEQQDSFSNVRTLMKAIRVVFRKLVAI